MGLIVLITPSLASGLISSDLETGGWQLLQMTPLSALTIITGKLLSVTWTLLLVHLGSMLPWAWRTGGVRQSERSLLRDALGDLPPNALLVADAGFTGYDLLCELRRRGVAVLVRVGRGVHLIRDLGSWRRDGKNIVYLWPNDQRRGQPLRLRLIRVGSMYLITDVTDPRELSAKAAAELYRRRWGLEVTFRSLKQTLARRAVRSGTAAHARMELNWAIAGLWVLSLLGAAAIAAAGHPPHRLSIGATLTAVRASRLRPMTRRSTAAAPALRHPRQLPTPRQQTAAPLASQEGPAQPRTPRHHQGHTHTSQARKATSITIHHGIVHGVEWHVNAVNSSVAL
jgi:hypothetical protein